MNREERERMVDRLLNEALAPQDVEPRAGLEQRILAHLRVQPEPRRWWRWMWVLAVVAAAVLIVISLRPARPAQPTKAPMVVKHQPAPQPKTPPREAPSVIATHRKPVRKRMATSAITIATAASIAPRQPVFAPARLSEAERALLAMLQSKPGEAQALVQRQEQAQQEAAEFMEQAMTPRP